MTTRHTWQPLDLGDLVSRLREAQDLLAQAAVLGTAEDTARLAGMADLQARLAGEPEGGDHAHPRRPRSFR